MSISPVFGLPRVSTAIEALHRAVFRSGGQRDYLAQGGVIDGTLSRDFGNVPLTTLRAGLLMGRVTASGKYAPSILGVTDAAYASGTTLSITPASAVELVRRVGATGTFKLTGPSVASGTSRSVTVTYSAANVTTGDVTITALPVSAVWTLTPLTGTDGGTFKLRVILPSGLYEDTADITFNATGATFQASIDAALEALTILPATAVTVVSADTTGVSTMTWLASLGDVRMQLIQDNLTDGGVFEGASALVHTTVGVDGAAIEGAFIQPEDGSETPLTLIDDGYGIPIGPDSLDAHWAHIPTGGAIQSDQIIHWPSDTSLRQWIVDSLRANGNFTFSHKYAA